MEIIYILFIKKLPSTKENEENKKKYQNVVQDLYEAKKEHDKIVEKRKDFNNEIRYIHSEKAKKRQVMKEKRRVMEEKKAEAEALAREKDRQQMENEQMGREDFDIKDQ